ncbi:hypothetical protein Acr_00g0100740 [Actinidia rufa]|uniref:Uncharacterized protein n=1 Tax=Actinidia rufa TaxID=165716 RepID=A0A7J0E1N0_9ERIC|nr:hypothetical protein Acr_00g0100740 [Actinidia rufa]
MRPSMKVLSIQQHARDTLSSLRMKKRNWNWARSNRSLSNRGWNNILDWISHQSNSKIQSHEINYDFKDEESLGCSTRVACALGYARLVRWSTQGYARLCRDAGLVAAQGQELMVRVIQMAAQGKGLVAQF